MKTRSIARGIVGSVAALLGVMAAGCSADVAPGDSAEIGSTSEALTKLSGGSDPADLTNSGGTDQRRQFAAGCALKESSTEYNVILGGYDNGGVAKNTVLLATKNGTFASATTLSQARGELGAITAGSASAPNLCMAVGGFDGTNTRANVDLFRLSSGALSTVSNLTVNSLSDSRDRFAMTKCIDSNGDTHAVAVMGRSTGTTARASIEVSDAIEPKVTTALGGTAATIGWTKYTPSWSQNVYDFDMAKNGNLEQYLVSGGTGGGNRSNKIDTITFDGSCVPTVRNAVLNSNHNTVATLSASTEGNVVLQDSTDTFIVTAGATTGGLWNSGDKIVVNNWTPTSTESYVTKTASTGAVSVQTYRPTIVHNGTTTFLFGGGNAVSPTAGLVAVQEYTSGAWSHAAATDLPNASYGAVAILFPSGEYQAASGKDIASTGSPLLVDVTAFTP